MLVESDVLNDVSTLSNWFVVSDRYISYQMYQIWQNIDANLFSSQGSGSPFSSTCLWLPTMSIGLWRHHHHHLHHDHHYHHHHHHHHALQVYETACHVLPRPLWPDQYHGRQHSFQVYYIVFRFVMRVLYLFILTLPSFQMPEGGLGKAGLLSDLLLLLSLWVKVVIVSSS